MLKLFKRYKYLVVCSCRWLYVDDIEKGVSVLAHPVEIGNGQSCSVVYILSRFLVSMQF